MQKSPPWTKQKTSLKTRLLNWWEDIAYCGPLVRILDRPRLVTFSSPLNSPSTRTLSTSCVTCEKVTTECLSCIYKRCSAQDHLPVKNNTWQGKHTTTQRTSLNDETDPQHHRQWSAICNRTLSFLPTAQQKWDEYPFTRRQEKLSAMVKGCYFSSRCRGSNYRRIEAPLNSKHDKETEARYSKIQDWRSQMQLEWQTTTRSYTHFEKRCIQLASSPPTETVSFLQSLSFGTVSRCETVGSQRMYLPNAHVVNPSLLTIPYTAEKKGYTHMKHDERRYTFAKILKYVCSDVEVEPKLQILEKESFEHTSICTKDEARHDIRANALLDSWFSRTYFDVKSFNPLAKSCPKEVKEAYKNYETLTKLKYEQRILDVENISINLLVFACSGGAGPSASKVMSRRSLKLSEKRQDSYLDAIGYIRTQISFALLRRSVLCPRGSRSTRRQTDESSISAMVEEGRMSCLTSTIPIWWFLH